MPQTITQFRCLLASPSDVADDRNAVVQAVTHWNALIGKGLETSVEIIRWESHAVPDLSAPAQEVINRQLVDSCDFGIALFWSKLGTETANHPSGTAEEVAKLLDRGARILLYFCERAIPPSSLNLNEFQRLTEAKKEYQSMGLYASYSTSEDLTTKLQLHLTTVVTDLLQKNSEQSHPILTASVPNVNVVVTPALGGRVTLEDYVRISVQNLSPVRVYPSSLYIELIDKRTMPILYDDATGATLTKDPIQPGNSRDTFLRLSTLLEHISPAECNYVVFRDAVGRQYSSSTEALQISLKASS